MREDQNPHASDQPPTPEELEQHAGTVPPDSEAKSTIAPDGPITGPGIPFLPEPVDR